MIIEASWVTMRHLIWMWADAGAGCADEEEEGSAEVVAPLPKSFLPSLESFLDLESLVSSTGAVTAEELIMVTSVVDESEEGGSYCGHPRRMLDPCLGA